MRIRQLESFIRVCELGSVTKAAADLNIAQPALGLQMKALEREFGVVLFDRGPRGTVPTEAGELVLAEARHILRRLDALKAACRGSVQESVATFHLGLTPSLVSSVSGQLLSFFEDHELPFRLRIHEALSHVLLDRVQGGTLDVALVFDAPASPLMSREPWLRVPLYFIAARGSSFDRAEPIRLRELVEATFAILNPHGMVWRLVRETASRAGLEIRTPYQIDSMQMLKELIGKGTACGILPAGTVLNEVQSRLLVARPIVEPELFRTLFLVQPTGAASSKASRSLMDHVRGVLARACREESGLIAA